MIFYARVSMILAILRACRLMVYRIMQDHQEIWAMLRACSTLQGRTKPRESMKYSSSEHHGLRHHSIPRDRRHSRDLRSAMGRIASSFRRASLLSVIKGMQL
jgi:hypothetical protein